MSDNCATQPLVCTPTQQRLLNLLSDGLPHARKELQACLSDELSCDSNLRVHIYNLRKLLRPRGANIIRITKGLTRVYYCYVRRLASPYE